MILMPDSVLFHLATLESTWRRTVCNAYPIVPSSRPSRIYKRFLGLRVATNRISVIIVLGEKMKGHLRFEMLDVESAKKL